MTPKAEDAAGFQMKGIAVDTGLRLPRDATEGGDAAFAALLFFAALPLLNTGTDVAHKTTAAPGGAVGG